MNALSGCGGGSAPGRRRRDAQQHQSWRRAGMPGCILPRWASTVGGRGESGCWWDPAAAQTLAATTSRA